MTAAAGRKIWHSGEIFKLKNPVTINRRNGAVIFYARVRVWYARARIYFTP